MGGRRKACCVFRWPSIGLRRATKAGIGVADCPQIHAGCAPYSNNNSARIFSPDSAAIATCALHCALCLAFHTHASGSSRLAWPSVRKTATTAVPSKDVVIPRIITVLRRVGVGILREQGRVMACGVRQWVTGGCSAPLVTCGGCATFQQRDILMRPNNDTP